MMPKRVMVENETSHLRAWRKHAKLTLAALAEAIGSSKANLSNIEIGRTRLTSDMAEAIARRYGITAEMLRAGPPDRETALELDLLVLFREASERAKRAILDSARAIAAMDREG